MSAGTYSRESIEVLTKLTPPMPRSANNNAVLALSKNMGLKVNACGRLIDITPDGASSVLTLRRELVSALNVSNPASLQVLDVTGKVILTDQDLELSIREAKHPFQAKLTAAALHEIEQKKLEGRSKEHNLLSLQWQIVIEQVAGFSYELANVAGTVQSAKDQCQKVVRDFEEQEELRRHEMMGLIQNEVLDRKAAQSDILAKVDAMMQLILQEQNTREVTAYQLNKQIEQVNLEINNERNTRALTLQENQRAIANLHHDIRLQQQKDAEKWSRTHDSLQRFDTKHEEHGSNNFVVQQRLQSLEGELEKLRAATSQIDSFVNAHRSEVAQHIQRTTEELERARRDGTVGKSVDFQRLSQEHETAYNNIGNRVQRARDEMFKAHQDTLERTKLLEARCTALEKDHMDKAETVESKHRSFVDKMNHAVSALDSFQMEQGANEAILKNTVTMVDDLLERMRQAEINLDCRVPTDHWKQQVDSINNVTMKQDVKISQLERELQMRFAQEAAHRDMAKAQLQCSMKSCLEKVAGQYKDEKESASDPRNPSPMRKASQERGRSERALSTDSLMIVNRGTPLATPGAAWPGRPIEPQEWRRGGTPVVTQGNLMLPIPAAQTVQARALSPTPQTQVFMRSSVPAISPTVSSRSISLLPNAKR